jgi:transposase
MLNAVGIDVSKGRSTVAVLQPGGIILRKPFDVHHKSKELHELVQYLVSLDGETRIVMECTGRYHEPILNTLSEAGLFVSAVNPHLIRNYGNNTIRKVKTDPADAKKIARYTLDNWASLREYSGMDTTRSELKALNSQFTFFTKQKVAAKANLIALLDETYPGANKLFNSPVRPDGSEKWVDYVYSFWHVDCVRKRRPQGFHLPLSEVLRASWLRVPAGQAAGTLPSGKRTGPLGSERPAVQRTDTGQHSAVIACLAACRAASGQNEGTRFDSS